MPGCVHWVSRQTMDCIGVCTFTVEFLRIVFHKLFPPPSPPTPLATLAQNWCTPPKNELKWSKIKKVTNSKLYYIKYNRSISPVLLNKAGLKKQKLVTLIKTFKTGISTIITRCELGQFSRGQSHVGYGLISMEIKIRQCGYIYTIQ